LAPSITHAPSWSFARVFVLLGVRAGLGLGQPEGPEALATAQPRHPLALLVVGAEQPDRLGAQRGVRAHGDGHGGVDAGEFLDGQRVGQRVAAPAAVLLGERDAHEPQLAKLGGDRVGKGLGGVELPGHRSDLAAGEVAHRAADELVVVGEVEVHA